MSENRKNKRTYAMPIGAAQVFLYGETEKNVMAYYADPSIQKTIDEWIDQFDMFPIYKMLPQILELWGENLEKQVAAKKDWQK